MSLTQIQETLQQAARRLWPDYNAALYLRPQLDASRGDLSSDFCLGLAAWRKESPHTLARQLLDQLNTDASVEIRAGAGYINVRFKDIRSLRGGARLAVPQEAQQVWTVIVAPLDSSLSKGAYARLLALAVLQRDILRSLGREVYFYVGARAWPTVVATLDLWAAELAELVTAEPVAARQLERELHSCLSTGGDRPGVVWLGPRALPAGNFAALAGIVGQGERRLLQCPSERWLAGSLSVEAIQALLQHGSPATGALLLYLAQPVLGSDLDAAVPVLAERDNLGWFCSSLQYRCAQLGGGSELAEIPGPVDAVLRLLVQRGCFLPDFFRRAAYCGEVRDLVQVLGEFAAALNICLNRVKAARADDSVVLPVNRGRPRDFFAGACTCLSAMIESWELLRQMQRDWQMDYSWRDCRH